MSDTTEDTPRRGPNGKFLRTTDTARRDGEAAELRSRGCTYQQIADQFGYSNRTNARRAVERALAATVREPADEVRTLHLAQLDELTREALAVLHRPHVMVSHGRIVQGTDGQPLLDDGPVLQAIDRLIRIQERRAKLLGLDAPIEVQGFTIDQIDAEIRALTEQMKRAERESSDEASNRTDS
jgi:hypothetical protein